MKNNSNYQNENTNARQFNYECGSAIGYFTKSDYIKPGIEPKPAKPAAKTNTKTEAEPVTVDGLQLVDYSEKAIAVIGNTKPISEQLKKIGGRFNSRLSCGAGWIFSKRKESELRTLLAL